MCGEGLRGDVVGDVDASQSANLLWKGPLDAKVHNDIGSIEAVR